eukprot:107200_1
MGRVANFFEKYGVHKRDIPQALLMFKGLNYVTWSVLVAGCYRFRPSRYLARTRMVQGWRKRYPRFRGWQDYARDLSLRTSKQLAQYSTVRAIPRGLGLKPQYFVYALAEATIMYKLTLPITLPIQFQLLMLYFSKRLVSISESMDAAEEISKDISTLSLTADSS